MGLNETIFLKASVLMINAFIGTQYIFIDTLISIFLYNSEQFSIDSYLILEEGIEVCMQSTVTL